MGVTSASALSCRDIKKAGKNNSASCFPMWYAKLCSRLPTMSSAAAAASSFDARRRHCSSAVAAGREMPPIATPDPGGNESVPISARKATVRSPEPCSQPQPHLQHQRRHIVDVVDASNSKSVLQIARRVEKPGLRAMPPPQGPLVGSGEAERDEPRRHLHSGEAQARCEGCLVEPMPGL